MTGERARADTDQTEAELVREPGWIRYGSWLACPLLGVALVLLLKLALEWLATVPWVPFDGKMRLLANIPMGWAVLAAVVVGGGAGVAFAYLWDRDRLSVRVAAGQVELRRGRKVNRVDREGVSGVFVDGEQLVVLDTAGAEPAREDLQLLSPQRVLAAFRAYDWPVLAGDPHAEEFRLWVHGDPLLPRGADVLLEAREKALRKALGDDDVRRLRDQLVRDGVVVRQEGKQQYWRPALAGN